MDRVDLLIDVVADFFAGRVSIGWKIVGVLTLAMVAMIGGGFLLSS
jgi:hypothetical protein